MKKTTTTKQKKMGRPTKDPNEKKSHVFSVKITPLEFIAVKRVSKKLDQTPSELIRGFITYHTKNNDSWGAIFHDKSKVSL